MRFPDGWQIGAAKVTSDQWFREFLDYVRQAENETDVRMLRTVLADRAGLITPASCNNLSRALTNRAAKLGVLLDPVTSPLIAKPRESAISTDESKWWDK